MKFFPSEVHYIPMEVSHFIELIEAVRNFDIGFLYHTNLKCEGVSLPDNTSKVSSTRDFFFV